MIHPLETPRLAIEPLRPSHAAEMFPVLRDPRLYVWIPGDPPASEEELRAAYIRQAGHDDPREAWLNWIIRLRGDGRCVGYVQATVPRDSAALLAWMLSPGAWGQGYAAEACAAAIRHLSADRGVRELRALVDSRNEASIRLAQRLGFARLGFRPRADFFKGSWSDEIEFGLTLG